MEAYRKIAIALLLGGCVLLLITGILLTIILHQKGVPPTIVQLFFFGVGALLVTSTWLVNDFIAIPIYLYAPLVSLGIGFLIGSVIMVVKSISKRNL